MLDRANQTQLMQRAKGCAKVRFVQKSGKPKLADLHQSGCLKALLPNVHGQSPEVVLVNTAGGATGGDQLSVIAAASQNSSVTITTQTAERIYRSIGGAAQINVHLQVEGDANLMWLPQETIIFDGAHLNRQMNVEIADTGSALLLESFMLGRKAMNETISECRISDQWRVCLGDKLVFAEAMKIDDAMQLGSVASLSGNLAFATMALVERDAHDRLEQLRALVCDIDIQAAASAWNDVLIARFVAQDAYHLRAALIPVLEKFNNQPLPRVWQL